MSAWPEVDSEDSDSTHEMSYASGTTSPDGSEHTQTMNFDNYINWYEATHPSPNPGTPPEPVLSPVCLSPASRGVTANLPYCVTDETIQALRYFAEWAYTQLHALSGISLGSLYRMVNRNSASQSNNQLMERQQRRTLGRQPVVTDEIQSRLITRATADSHNHRLLYTQIAGLEGIPLGRRALSRLFESEGYHRRVARVKPFLSQKSKIPHFEWGEHFHDWSREDLMNVIWSDECTFSMGEDSGTVWVTRRLREEFEEDCLVPRFPRLTTGMVWGAIYRNQKSSLVIWATPHWGCITGSTYVDHIIPPILYPWWEFLHSTGCTNSGYIYLQQDNAPAHPSHIAHNAMQELGLSN